MSAIGSFDTKCECGEHLQGTMFNSANEMDKEVIKLIITGEIMTTVCPKCGKKYFLNRPILFSDIMNSEFIWYAHESLSEFKTPGAMPWIKVTVIRDYKTFANEVAKRTGLAKKG